MDGARSWAEAVAILDGRIVFVGSDKDLAAHVGPATRVVDPGGRMLMPAMQDVHIHPISAGLEANACNLNGLDTVDEYVAAIKKYTDANPDRPWITGGGWRMSAFGPGARARCELLDAVEAARGANGDLGHRHHILHLELIDPADIPRLRKLGVIANFQPLWAYADAYITDLTIPFLGPKRSEGLYPIGSVYRSGAVVAFGSDWSVSSANPFEEIETAVTRMGALGETSTPFLPDERLGLPEALAAFTVNAAYTNRLEKLTGSVEVGKLADFVVLDRNLFEIPPTEISGRKSLLTLFEGKVVHGDPGAFTDGPGT